MLPLITIVPTRYRWSLKAQEIVPSAWQGQCDVCGWKSRELTGQEMAKAHMKRHVRESHSRDVELETLKVFQGQTFTPRPTRDETLMGIAKLVSRRSTCSRAFVGAVIAREGRVLSMGYNGSPPGMPHCNHGQQVEFLPFGCTKAIHAEMNAIAWAARAGVNTEDATLYTTHQPCRACGQAIVAAGIKTVWFAEPYHSAYEFPESVKVGRLK